MNAAEHRELIRHVMEDGFNAKDLSVVYDSFHTDYKRHGHGVPSMGSLEEHVADLKSRQAAFDEARFEIQWILGDESGMSVFYIFKGRHRQTGREVSRPSAAFFTVRNGKISEGHVFADGAGFAAEVEEAGSI